MRVVEPFRIFSELERNAVIWLNGTSSPCRPIWTGIWNKAGLRVATDGAANFIIRRKDELSLPHIVSGDMDSIEAENLGSLTNSTSEVIITPDQDKTDLTKAIEIVGERLVNQEKIDRILILGGLSGRFDHTLATLNSLLVALRLTNKTVHLLNGTNYVNVIPKGITNFVIDLSKITGKCGVVPFCQQPTVVTCEGFRWNLEDSPLEFGALISTSNEIVSEKLTIKSSSPLIFTMQLKDELMDS